MDPGLVAILKNLGLSIGMDQLYEFGSRLKGQSPYEKGLSSQMGYMNRMMPDLANEAAGRPSFATKQMMRQVGSEVSRSQQSFAASQMRANPYMTSQTTPARVGQRQYQQMKTEAQANIMAQQQGRAQQMIYAGGQSAMMAMGEQEQYRQKRKDDFLTDIGSLWGDIQGENDPGVKSRFETFLKELGRLIGFNMTQQNTQTQSPTLNSDAYGRYAPMKPLSF